MKTKPNNKAAYTRRSFLKVLLASGISKSLITSSPLVSGVLYSRYLDAQESAQPYRSAVVYVPGGGIHDFWAPTGSGESMQMAGMSQGYSSVKTQCNFLLNMSHENAGHGRQPRILSNRWGGSDSDSYDVFMGKQLGPTMPFTYVNLGVHSNGNGYLTREGNNQIPFQDNPFTVFNLLFGNNSGGSEKTPILDIHANAARAIRTKLAGYEVHRMESHLDAISDTQRRLDDLSGGGLSCSTAPSASEFSLNYDTFSQQARLQADIAVAALKCNLTSSVSLAFGNHQSNFRIPELNYTGAYHQSIHGGSGGKANYPYYVEMRNHLGSLTAYFIKKLEDEGILDSTVLIETTDMGHADQHSNSNVPLMIAGGGSRINKARTTSVGSSYHNLDLLHTGAKACGVDLDFGREIPGVLV
jgi:hypothetical protein